MLHSQLGAFVCRSRPRPRLRLRLCPAREPAAFYRPSALRDYGSQCARFGIVRCVREKTKPRRDHEEGRLMKQNCIYFPT